MDVSYGLDRSTNLWVHGRDILHDIFGHNLLHKEFGIDFCNEIFKFLHTHGVIGMDVASTGGNNGFGADLEFTQKIEFEKDFVLKDLKSFVGSVVEEDSSAVKNSLLAALNAQRSKEAAQREEEREASRSCEHVPLGLDLGHWFSLIIGCSILAVGLELRHTDCQAGNPTSFRCVYQFNNRVTTLEKEVFELKKDDPLKTQVTTLVNKHLDARLGATRDEFMNFLSASLTERITEQVKNQLPQILPEEVSNFAPRVIQRMVTKSLDHAILAKESSQLQSSYEAVATLTEFELKKILIDKIDKSESYLAAPEHRECYEGLIKSYDLDKTLFSTYDKKRKTNKDTKSTKGPKAKESQFGSSKGDKSQSKSSGKSVHSEEPEFEVAYSDIPQDQEVNPGNDDEEPKGKVASKRDWFIKPKRTQEPTDPDWNDEKTLQQGPTQSWLMTLASSVDKPSKTFDELMSTPIDFSAYIMNGLKIPNLTQETLLVPSFRLLKGTRSNYVELEYDFKECYKALSEKLDWKNLEGGDYLFDLTKPLPLVMSRNHQKVPVEYFFNNDLKYLQGGISTITYTTSLTKTKVAQYDLPGIEDMVSNIWSPVKVAYDKHALWGISYWRDQRKSFYGYARGLESRHDVYSTKCILAVTQVEVMRKHRYGYLKEIVVRRTDNYLYTFKEGDFPRLRINDIEDMLLLKLGYSKASRRSSTQSQKLPEEDKRRNRLMRSDKLYKFSDRTLTGLQTSLDDITKNIRIEYLPKRRWCTLEKKRANIMIKAIDKQLRERRMMRSLKKFVGRRHYGTDLRLLQRTI
ncbi:hypothetical protein Tco_1361366 [Tanacetum coccineum]